MADGSMTDEVEAVSTYTIRDGHGMVLFQSTRQKWDIFSLRFRPMAIVTRTVRAIV